VDKENEDGQRTNITHNNGKTNTKFPFITNKEEYSIVFVQLNGKNHDNLAMSSNIWTIEDDPYQQNENAFDNVYHTFFNIYVDDKIVLLLETCAAKELKVNEEILIQKLEREQFETTGDSFPELFPCKNIRNGSEFEVNEIGTHITSPKRVYGCTWNIMDNILREI